MQIQCGMIYCVMRKQKQRSSILPMEVQKRPRAIRLKEALFLFGGAITVGTAVGAGLHFWSGGEADASRAVSTPIKFVFCSERGASNCVVDGDTIRLNGEKVRLVGLNTPEISGPACPAEAAKGEQAKSRLLDLLNSGKLVFAATADRNRDRYGRLLREVRVDGESVADIMIWEGLAEPYQGGQKRSWC
jgi:micrococcal nuclease